MEQSTDYFPYFIMKGLEGGADLNEDNKITTGELHLRAKESNT